MTKSVAGTLASPTITAGPGGGRALPRVAQENLLRTVVDTHLHQPDMFELTFLDKRGDVVSSGGLRIGTQVRIAAHEVPDRTDQVLMVGEVTSIEARCEHLNTYLVVRGYDLCHRLQRARRSRTFVNMTDSDIAAQIARAAGLTEILVEPSAAVHAHTGQVDQTDWEFLTQRAREIGYETGITAGKFYFRKASTVSSGTTAPVNLTFRENLLWFRPRVTAGNIAPKVEVRVWDPMQGKVAGSVTSAASGTARSEGTTPSTAARKFVTSQPPAASAQPGAPAVGNLGPAPETTAYVVHNLPVAQGSAIDAAASSAALALAERLASTFAEADGEAAGNPLIQAGSVLEVGGVDAVFAGPWLVTNANHVFDLTEGGYLTRFVVSGRNDRSLLGLTSLSAPRAPGLPGVSCAIVTNNNDPQRLGRVKVALPWLSPDYETDWSPVVQLGGGKRSGSLFLPEVGDEVLVGFEFGDPRRPYVLGGVLNSATSYTLGGEAIKATGQSADVVRRGFVSPAGNRLVFSDELPPNGGAPATSAISIGTRDDALLLEIDQVQGTVTLKCLPARPNSKADKGTINIQCGNGGAINIATGSGGSVAIDGGATLELKAQTSISIESSGELKLKGSTITLN